ncbi:hypothetical protein TIFTF001_009557 [Ficus carica]|uniref:Uncharacterized protein n=1 Tax=Ficus carica TaxID=3494 RepID=A0AA88A718_FICCA|nr:hypothetical protein TIFTF001_009557 [Ficus carica]
MTAIAEKEAERREKDRGKEKKERGEKGSRRPKGEKREKCRENRDREMTERALEEDLERRRVEEKAGGNRSKESKKVKSAVEEKILEAEEVFHNIVMQMTDHSGMGDALWFEVTRAAICNTVENRLSSKRRPLKKSDRVHYNIASFSHALLVWACESLPSIAANFTTKYDEAISRMLSWTTTDNVKFDDVMSAFTAVGEKQPRWARL